METFSGPRATDPFSQSHEGDTLESLRDEMVKFAYEMQSRLETLTDQVTQQFSDQACPCKDPGSAVEQSEQNNLPEPIPYPTPHPVVFQSDRSGNDENSIALTTSKPTKTAPTRIEVAAEISERAELLETSDPLQRLAAIKLRLEQQLSKGEQ
ncbi:hypothetical protein [Planctomycetes bacterium K23_9]|uniref:Uncharacterized protein n=1 Tax=Stieleria marina TaxID=1930275 RepID=A0A517NM07_9BACT|nr:hypothetical protein K239x_00930 [Planctomycetes bacterium K23_9]